MKKNKSNWKKSLITVGMLGGFLYSYILLNANSIHREYLINSLQDNVMMVTDVLDNGSGTGFYIQSNGGRYYVLTNDHICGLADSKGQLVLKHKNGKVNIVKIIKRDNVSDLCLLDAPNEQGLKFAGSLNEKDILYIYGYPLGIGQVLSSGYPLLHITLPFETELIKEQCVGGSYKWTTKDVKIFGVKMGEYDVCEKNVASILTTAIIYPGNSGSPVINSYGNVTGIAFAAISKTGFAFIIPLWEINRFIVEVESEQK